MSRGLVGHNVRDYATSQELRVHLGGVPNQTHATRNLVQLCLLDDFQALIQVVSYALEISVTDCLLDGLLVHLYCQGDAIVHCYGQRLSTPHLAQARCQHDSSSQRSAEMFLGNCRERFVRALKYTLSSNVSPRPRSHLSVHDEPLLLKFVEVVPGRPFGNNHAVNDQDSRSKSMGLEDRHWLAALNEKCLIFA